VPGVYLVKVDEVTFPTAAIPVTLWDVEDPTLSRQSTHRWQ
jgi:hypothetical protein